MKILHVATTLNRGGAEKHIVDLVLAQLKDGHQVAVAHLRQGYDYWAGTLLTEGAEVVDLGLVNYPEPGPLVRLIRLLRTWKPDQVHSHLQPAEVYSRLGLLAHGVGRPRFLITKHNDERFYPGPGARQLGRWVARRAHRVIAISEAVRQNTCFKDLGLPNGQVVTIRYGIDPAPYRQVTLDERLVWRASLGLLPEHLVFGTAARFVPQKDLATMLSGFAGFCRRAGGGHHARLVLIGRGPLEADLRRLAETLGVRDQVIFAGFREDMVIAMRSLDVFLLSSIYEGFGLVLVEAMAAGLPVVATQVSSIPEIVVEGQTGWLFPSGDGESLAARLLEIEDPAIRRQMGVAGQHRVETDFRLETVWERTRQLYGL